MKKIFTLMMGAVVFGTVIGGIIGGGGLAPAPAHADEIDRAIKHRQAMFKANGNSMKAIVRAIKAGDMDTINGEAYKIQKWAAVMLDYFPPGSDRGKTDALPAIWSNWDRFAEMANANELAATELAAFIQRGNTRALENAVQKLGGTCKTCHQNFKKN